MSNTMSEGTTGTEGTAGTQSLYLSIASIIDNCDKFTKDYKSLEEKVNYENKSLQELIISYETLSQHIDDVDMMSGILIILERKKTEVLRLSTKYIEQTRILNERKELCKEFIKKCFSTYLLLDKIYAFKRSDEQEDPFITEMSNIIFSNNMDHLQITDNIVSTFEGPEYCLLPILSSPVYHPQES